MKKRWQKNILIVLAVLVLLVVLPFAINSFILSERHFEIVGEGKDWLQFWPVYLSAIGTIAMTLVTYYSLLENRKQIASMIESEGAQLVFSLYGDYEYVYLKVTNIGRSVARDIRLHMLNNLEGLERNAGLPFDEGIIRHFKNLTPIPLLLPYQSDYIPLYISRVQNGSIKEKNGVKYVEMFGDLYFPDNITGIAEYFKNQTFTVTGHFTNYLNQKHSVSQDVDNTFNVTLSEENTTIERSIRELNKNLSGIKTELHGLDTSKLKDIDAVLDRVKSELHSMGDSLKKIEGKVKK